APSPQQIATATSSKRTHPTPPSPAANHTNHSPGQATPRTNACPPVNHTNHSALRAAPHHHSKHIPENGPDAPNLRNFFSLDPARRSPAAPADQPCPSAGVRRRPPCPAPSTVSGAVHRVAVHRTAQPHRAAASAAQPRRAAPSHHAGVTPP